MFILLQSHQSTQVYSANYVPTVSVFLLCYLISKDIVYNNNYVYTAIKCVFKESMCRIITVTHLILIKIEKCVLI